MPRGVRATEFLALIVADHAERFLGIGARWCHGDLDMVAPGSAPVARSDPHKRSLVWWGNLGGFDDSVAGARWVGLVRGHQIHSADRARCVREEPPIDAFRMKGVAAFGQQAELLVVFEFADTDGTLVRFFPMRLEALHDIVGEHREAFDDGSVKTTVARVHRPYSIVHPLLPGGRSQVLLVCGTSAEADREKHNDEKRAYQHGEDNRHGWAKIAVVAAIEIIIVISRARAMVVIRQYHAIKWGSKTQNLRVSPDD